MRLTSFSITNFRSITSAHKINIGDVTVLVGKNNEGKSNILKALNISLSIINKYSRNRYVTYPRYTRYGRYSDPELYDWDRDFPIYSKDRKRGLYTVFKLDFLLDDLESQKIKKISEIKIVGNFTIEIVINQKTVEVNVKKRGIVAEKLRFKKDKIIDFVSRSITFNYIPAIRTEDEAIDIVRGMLANELAQLEKDPSYEKALSTIKDLQQPALRRLARQIKEPLKEFLPNIKKVKISIPDDLRRMSYRRDCEIEIDDGKLTSLEFKGDGVKSIVALALLKNRNSKENSITAIEEPESHLHSGAIHNLAKIIGSISSGQVIVTTHNPLFVNREHLKSNVIIEGGKAMVPKNIVEIRDALGVRASDNLRNANYVLVVEGQNDSNALKKILPAFSKKIKKYLEENFLVIDYVGGAGNICYKLSTLKNSLCTYHVFLDNDNSGASSIRKAISEGLLNNNEYNLASCIGMSESELEDCLSLSSYRDELENRYNIRLDCKEFKNNNKKWSERIKDVFKSQGKLWDEKVEVEVKSFVAGLLKSETGVVEEIKKSSILALVSSLEKMIEV